MLYEQSLLQQFNIFIVFYYVFFSNGLICSLNNHSWDLINHSWDLAMATKDFSVVNNNCGLAVFI